MSAFTGFYFRPGENEVIETCVRLKPDCRSAIYGQVRDCSDKPICDAAVLLFEAGGGEDDLRLAASSFTDEHGHFVFGPLDCGQTYTIKVYKNLKKIRELVIKPDPCEPECPPEKNGDDT